MIYIRNTKNWSNIVAFSAGWEQTMGLKADGSVDTIGIVGTLVYRGAWKSKRCDTSRWRNIGPISEEKRNVMKHRCHGKCVHCGGEFVGLFTKKCKDCGKPKDY